MRGLEVLRLTNQLEHASITEIHKRSGIPKATVLRMIETLINAGFVARIWAQSQSSKALQYAGLGLYTLAWAIMFSAQQGHGMEALAAHPTVKPVSLVADALLDEPGDHGIRRGGFQQLNARSPGRQHRNLHFLLLHSLTQADGESQLLFVEL